MKRVAIFGNTGAGKSTLAKHLAELTRLPLYPIDIIQYRAGAQGPARGVPESSCRTSGAGRVDHRWLRLCRLGLSAVFQSRHASLVYIDLPLATHYWWVTKRLMRGLFVNPEGWPENSPMWRSTMNSYKVAWLCHTRLTPKYRKLVADVALSKRVHHLKSRAEITAFLDGARQEHAARPTSAPPEFT
jgi:adenylate kinase family enzyme